MQTFEFRDDQIDLICEGLKYWKKQLETGSCSNAHAAAGRYTYRRIDEILELLGTTPT